MNLATSIDGHPGDAVALISRRRETTYGELRDQVAGLRGGLVGAGVEPGDRVGIIAANNWYFVAAYLATLGAGAVAVPLDPQSPAREVERQLAAVSARAVFVGPAATRAWGGVHRSALPGLEVVVAGGDTGIEGALQLDDMLGARPADVVGRAPEDLAVLMFTSGTAGAPRAAMLSHGNLRSNIEQLQDFVPRAQRADDVVLGVLPFSHIFGLNVVLGLSVAAGSTVLLVERFDPQSAALTVEEHGVTVISGAPTMWGAWASLPGVRREAFASVRLAASGASRLRPETAAAVRERLGVELTEGYGLTEAAPVVSSAAGVPAPPGSIGVPLPGVRVRLVDADGNDALVGDAGEIWVAGPNVFAGYWDDPEATRTCLTPDGWLRTGDVAVVDDEGFLYLIDRVKDLIIVSGFNVYPAEVEEVIIEHPGVAGVAVVGVEHPHSGEAVTAYVVVEAGTPVEEDDVIAFCEQRLARYKCPAKVLFVDELPTGLGGKLIRRQLRDA